MGIKLQMIAGAILLALILAMGVGILSDAIIPVDRPVVATAPRQAAPPETVAAAPDAATPPEDDQPTAASPSAAGAVALIADADPARGQAAAKKCAACHTFDPGGANRVGPNLHGVVGADIGSKPGFRYSDALTGLPGGWTYEALDAFLARPAEFAKGTRMVFAGVSNPQERADLIAYLRSISPDAPPPPQG